MTVNIPQIFIETAKDFCIKDPKIEMQKVNQEMTTIKLTCPARKLGSYNYTFQNVHTATSLENHVEELRMIARGMAVKLSTYEEPT